MTARPKEYLDAKKAHKEMTQHQPLRMTEAEFKAACGKNNKTTAARVQQIKDEDAQHMLAQRLATQLTIEIETAR